MTKSVSPEGGELTENLLARLVDRLDASGPRAPVPTPPPPATARAWWVVPLVALVIVGGLAAAAFVALPLLNRNPTITVNPNIISTNNNTVAVQLTGLADRLSDPTLIVLIDNRPYTREQLAQPISLTIGDHDLIVQRDGVVIESRKLQIGQGDKQIPIPPPPDKGAPGESH